MEIIYVIIVGLIADSYLFLFAVYLVKSRKISQRKTANKKTKTLYLNVEEAEFLSKNNNMSTREIESLLVMPNGSIKENQRYALVALPLKKKILPSKRIK
jgi:hypothetical protein